VLTNPYLQFYRGANPASLDESSADPRTEYCQQLSDHYTAQSQRLGEGQAILSAEAALEELHPLPHLHDSNCAFRATRMNGGRLGSENSPEAALLRFMVDATPSDKLAADIMENYDAHLAKMTSSMHTNFVGGSEMPFQLIENVPDAVSPVKAKMAYVQVPNGAETTLKLVYKVCHLAT
jgi:extracellular elastinolytic metalloproteinase